MSKIICCTLLVLLCASFTQAGIIPTCMTIGTPTRMVHAQTPVYTESEPINITSNEELVTMGLNGSGTESDPYEIAGLNITADTHCIRIENTTLHLRIRSCYFDSISHFRYDVYDDPVGLGVYMNNVSNCVVEDCVITGKYHGIFTFESRNCGLSHNTIHDCLWDGIRIHDSQEFSISLNIIREQRYGIYVRSSDYMTLSHDSVSECEVGIYMTSCDFVTAANDVVSNNERGFSLKYVNQFQLEDLHASDNGIGINLNQVYDGTMSDCTTTSCDSTGLYLQMILNVRITGGTFSSNRWGVRLSSSSDVTLDSSTCYSNEVIGILVHSSHDCNITANDIRHNEGYGVYLDWDSENMTFYGNTFYHEEGMDAIDHSQGTVWDDGIDSGNRWTDWHGLGIYEVPGDGENVDRYPSGWVVYPWATYFATFAFIAVVIIFVLYKSRPLIKGRLKSLREHLMRILIIE